MQTSPRSPGGHLARLTTLSATLANELTLIPEADAISTETAFIVGIDDYWSAASADGTPRRELCVAGLEQALRDEVALKIHDGTLHPSYAACLPVAGGASQPEFSALHLRVNPQTPIEIAGALVITIETGHTLLWLPGIGVEGFATQDVMRNAITPMINDPALRGALLDNSEQRYQDLWGDIERDADLFLEPLHATDWTLTPISGSPFDHAFARQLNKQRDDIRYAFGEDNQHSADPDQRTLRVNQAARMPGLFGPEAMLALREAHRRDRKERKNLPDWFKNASQEDSRRYLQGLQDYDQLRATLLSVLGGAASPEQFATVRLRAQIENDLGYDLDPEHLILSTWRNLPLTNEPYKVSRPLTQLALYGLHPGDMAEDSVFLRWSTLNLQGQPLGSAYPGLTNRYLGELIEKLDLRSTFALAQREAYGSPIVQRLMGEVTRQQVKALAYAARLQGHIQPQDFDLIESLDPLSPGAPASNVCVQQVKLNNRDTLSDVLVFRKDDAQGRLDRLVLFTPDIPRDRQFQAFDNERQLLHELVSWSARAEMSTYLLNHVKHASRAALEQQLYDLSQKAQPPADFITLVTQQNYDEGLRALVIEHIRLALSDQNQHTPDWYLRASRQQRQEVVALEDAINAARQRYQAKLHTQVQAFEDYVHERATQKINALLGTAEGSVDPDTIISTSAREKLSYTQMLRNGYNDSVNPISTSPLSEARFSGPDGIDLTPLTAEKVARSVHGKWLSDDYVARIRNTLLNSNSTGYTYRRRASLLIIQLQMSAAALRGRLNGEINEQQYQWLKASIEQMHVSDEVTRRRYPIYPVQFKLHNTLIATDVPALGEALDFLESYVSNDTAQIENVQGCYLLTPDSPGNPQQALLYTPNAPDGVTFRPFDTFVDTLKREGMSDYYKDRCRISENRKLAFFLADMKKGGNSQPPSLPASPFADLYTIGFNRVIERQIRNVEDTTTGRNDMVEKLIWTSVELIATAMTLPFPPASFTVGALLAFRDSAHALKAFSEGDREAASAYIFMSLLNSIGAVGDLDSGLKGFSGVLRRVTQNAGQNPTLQTAKQLKLAAPPLKDLRPVQLHGEQFWVAKPTPSGHAPLYRGSAQEPQKLLATGQFAEKDLAGTWQPLRRETSPLPAASQGTANRAYAVDVSLQGTTPIASGHAQGVTLIQGQHYIDIEGLTFRVQFDSKLRCWTIIDRNNPFAFFGKQPVRLNDQGQWQVIDGLNLRGGVRPTYQPLTEEAAGSSSAARDISDYELPMAMREDVYGIIDPKVSESLRDYGPTGDFKADFIEAMRVDYRRLRQTLYRDANAFFERVTLAPRPTLPRVDATTTPDQLIKGIFANSHGLVIGEAPASIASKQWLIDNMPLLVEQRVEVLYIEHLFSDRHLPKLEKYKKRGSSTKSGSQELKVHFEFLNAKALRNSSKEYDYYHLVKAAHRHNIEVKPLSSSVSYPVTAIPVEAAVGDNAAAQKMSNFFGHKLINADTAAKPERRWVALLEQDRMNTYQQVPGMTELQGAISVRVKDVPAGRPTRVGLDAGESIAGKSTVKGDFWLEMANPMIVELPGSSSTMVRTAADQLDASVYQIMEGKPYIKRSLDPRTYKLTEQWLDTPNPYAGPHGFTLDDAGQWRRANPAEWNADNSLTAIQQSLIDADYDMPVDLRAQLHELANFQHKGLDQLYFIQDSPLAQARQKFFRQRQQLQTDARRVISGDLPPRPTLPDVPPETTARGFLESLYEHTSAVVIGESHSSVASKKLIIDNLPHLAEQKVKTLYLEHLLTDLHQVDLDRFAETGQMSKSLLHELRKMDQGHHTDLNKVYTFENLVIKTREHGIEVRAIDCAASYHLKGLSSAPPTHRQQMMNYFASRTIRKHQQVMGAHKWIALVGNSHANMYQKIVPGIAELEGGIGVRVLDVGPGQARVVRDAGENVVERFGTDRAFLQCDYRLEMETLETPVVRNTATESEAGRAELALPVEARLRRPGMFLIEESEAGPSVIVHRSRDNTIHRTPVVTNAEGKLYIERESWALIHLQPYEDLQALILALEDLNLTRVG